MRQEVVTSIARGLGAVASGQLSVTLGVWGEPGIGKTHLAAQVLREVPCAGASISALATAPALLAALPRPRVLPGWAQVPLARLAEGEAVDPAAGALAISAVLGALAPFALHIDDLHAARGEHLELLTALGGAVRRIRGVGLLATSRAELPPPFTGRRLAPLEVSEVAALLEGAVGGPVPPDAATWVYGRTGGHPLYTLEFARFLTRQGCLWSDGQVWHWRAPPGGTLPPTVDALITQHAAESLGHRDTRAVLEARALLPGDADEATWRAAAGWTPEPLTVRAPRCANRACCAATLWPTP